VVAKLLDMHTLCLAFIHMKEAVVGKLLKSSPADLTCGSGVVTYLVFPAIETNSSENVIASGGISCEYLHQAI
jgi:hypothetical protein